MKNVQDTEMTPKDSKLLDSRAEKAERERERDVKLK